MSELDADCKEGAILVVDDDSDQRWMIENYLGEKGFLVDTAMDGVEMWRKFHARHYDLVIMDVGLPGEDGFSLTRALRQDYDTGIIMVTAANELVDRVLGLEFGADDYLAKPFELRELHARTKSILRRRLSTSGEAEVEKKEQIFEFDQFVLDSKQFLVTFDGAPCFIEPKCLDVLIYLVNNRDRVVSKEELLSEVWAGRVIAESTLSTVIKQLRRSLKDNGKDQKIIRTVHGRGFQFKGGAEGE